MTGHDSPSRKPIAAPNLRKAVFDGYRRNLPHWRYPGATYFVTWRMHPEQGTLHPAERSLVADTIHHFDGQRYHILAWVVMDDHVHVLTQVSEQFTVEQIVHSWKSFSANRIQRSHGRKGTVWLREYFDRIVRDEKELQQKLYYTLNNPWKRWPDLDEYEWAGVHEDLR